MTPEPSTHNAFEQDKQGTASRDSAEAVIETLRQRGGVFVEAVRATRMAMALTDPTLPGNPIVFANQSFLELSGYSMEEVLGQQPHFMNGPDADREDAERSRRILDGDQDGVVETVQYAKDGRRFVATVLLSAFKDEDGRTLHHFLTWTDVTRRVEAEGDAADLRRSQAALRASEAKYRALFETMGQGFCELELVRDGQGRAVDQLYLELNPAFERLFGIAIAEAKGRRASEVFPRVDPVWTALFEEVARTGTHKRLEHQHGPLARWYEVFVYPRGGDRVVVLYEAITDRKRAEEALRESEERQAFLLALGDAVRARAGASDRIMVAARLLAERLTPSRILFAEFDQARGVADIVEGWTADDALPFPMSLRLADYEGPIMDDLRAGRVVRIDDVGRLAELAEHPIFGAIAELGVRALLSIPLIVDTELIVNLSVHHHEARHWTDQEVALVGDVAERLWAEVVRARAEAALRESEEKYRTIFESIDEGFLIVELLDDEHGRAIDYRFMEVNPAFERQSGLTDVVGRLAGEIAPDLEERWVRMFDHVSRTGEPRRFEDYNISTDRWYDCHITRVGGPGSRRLCSVFSNVSERKRAEAVQRESEERQAFLLKLSDALRGEIDERQVERVALDMLADQLSVDRAYITTSDYGKGETEVPVEVRRGELSPLVGIFRHADFPESAQQVNEGTLVVEDVETDTSLSELNRRSFGAVQIKALIGIGLRKGVSDIFWTLAVAISEPRKWSPSEVLLMEEAAERIMAALARTHAETALRESEERFRLLLQSVRDYAIFTTDRDGLITSWPAGAAAVYGWSEEEILGRSVDLTFVPEDLAAGAPREERETAAREGSAPNVRWHLRKDSSRIFIDGSTQPLIGADGQVHEFIKIGQDVTEARRTQQALSESEDRLRTLMEGIPQLVWRSCDEGRWTWSSPQWQAFTGQSLEESLALGWLDAVHPDDREATMRAWEAARPHGMLDVEYRVRRASDGEYLWHHTRSLPVRDEGGRVVEWLGTTTDMQELKELQERQAVMVAELQHRTRNLIAVVRSIAGQTMAATGPTEAFRDEFNHRLEALARVQGLLSRSDEEPITMNSLLSMELDALGAKTEPARIEIGGPPVPIRHSVVQTLALALHELATNARKYGALSNDRGRLDVRWRTYTDEKGSRLALEWTEIGGQVPKPDGEARHGYGRELIERALPYSLNARTSFEHDEAGLRCTIDMPLEWTKSRRRAA